MKEASALIRTPEASHAPEALASLPSSLLQGELRRIVASAAFRTSPRHRRFLDYLVTHAVKGDGPRLKEMTLGIEVFDRRLASFDPQRDTIVRVEARRLRSRLARYYDEEGADSLIEIVLPLGSYTPMLLRREVAGAAASLAVLPILDRSGEPTVAQAFRDDLFDALIEGVARVPGFKIIARNSALCISDRTADRGEDDRAAGEDAAIAKQLGVALLLRGVVDHDGLSLRLKLRLVRGSDGLKLWSDGWTFTPESNFATRDALTTRIVDAVQHALSTQQPRLANADAEREAAAKVARGHEPLDRSDHGPIDERARDLVDRGRYLMRHGNVDAYPQALSRFRAAAEIAPHYAAAHFGVARTLTHLVGMTLIPPDEGIDEAKRAVLEVLALDPQHGDAASLLAAMRQRYDHDWASAQAGYLAAIALTPGSLYVHFNYAFGLMFSGRFDEAAAELKLSRELDPLDIGQRAIQALLHIYRRDYAHAQTLLVSVLDDEPRHLLARSLLGALHLFCGRHEDALIEYRIAHEIQPGLSIGSVGIAQAHAMAGRRREAEAERAALLHAFEDRYLSAYQLSLIALRLGERDEAFAALIRAATERDPNFIAVLVDPSLDELRGDDRYAALLRTCGLDRVLPEAMDAN